MTAPASAHGEMLMAERMQIARDVICDCPTRAQHDYAGCPANNLALIERVAAALQARADRWEADYHRKDVHHQACITQRDQAEARIAALVAALVRFGHHADECAFYTTTSWQAGDVPLHPCTCGLDAARAPR